MWPIITDIMGKIVPQGEEGERKEESKEELKEERISSWILYIVWGQIISDYQTVYRMALWYGGTVPQLNK